MRKRIEQIVNGNFEYEVPGLILSCEKIQMTIKPGEDCRGEINLGCADDRKIKGYAVSTHRRLVLGMERFFGTTVNLAYGIDGAGLQPGEAFSGAIVLSSNVGEYQIPFSISVEKEPMKSHLGEIHTLDEFTDLAKGDFREAFRLFTSENFRRYLVGNLPKERALYLGMMTNPVTYQHLEEFLIAAGKKEPVHISLKEEKASFYQIRESVQEVLWVHKSGWGNLRLEIETRGDFLEVPKKVVTEEDFIGSTYGVEYIIRRERLSHGRHYGKILVKSPYETLVYEVLASKDKEIQVNINILEKKNRLTLMRDYLGYYLGQMTKEEWRAREFEIIRTLSEAGCDYPEYQLYEAYLHYIGNDIDKAQEILKKYQEKIFGKEDMELAGAYLYLCYLAGLLRRKEDVCRKVRSFYLQKRDSFLLLWVLLRLDEEYQNTPSKAVFQMEEIFALGCRSPFLYLEAWRMIEKDMNLLHRIGGLWTQVFLFAGKTGILTEELSMRMAYLSGYEKRFSGSLYRALCLAYERYPADDTLDAICKHIMKGEPGRREYFRWYELAIKQGLRLTRLYEYYIETMNPQSLDALPKTLLMYFTYNNALSDRKKAHVYANVIWHKEKDPMTYEHYREMMQEFAARKLREGKMNEDYAVLYQEFAGEPANQEEAEYLGKMLFTHRLYCDDKKVRNVVVRHSQMKSEEVYPCVNGVAYPRIYTEDAVVMFVDERQRRYVATVDYNLRKLMDETNLLPVCMEKKAAEPGFLLYMCQDGQITDENLELYRLLEEQNAFSEEYRREIRKKLLDYYDAHKEKEEIAEYLQQMNYTAFARVDKKTLLEILIDRGMYRDAYEIFCTFGGEGVSVENLLKLCSRMISEREEEDTANAEEELLSLADDIYCRGKYDEVILEYLLAHYQGSLDHMYEILESADGFEMDTYAYEEKLLLRTMFLLDYRPDGAKVLENYVGSLGKEKIIRAYLTFASYGSFLKGYAMQPFVRKCLQTAIEREWDMALVCRLALLESYAKEQDFDGKWENQAHQLLDEAAFKGILLSCYRKFPASFLRPWQLDDKVFAEYRGNPESSVTLYYYLDAGLKKEPVFLSEPMKSRYPGVFVKAFTLFYGEKLHYYFVEENQGERWQSPENTISVKVIEEENNNKYQMLNRILAARKLGKKEEVLAGLKEFLHQERYVKEMYIIEKE